GTYLPHPSYLLVRRKSRGRQQLNQSSLAVAAKKTLADCLGHVVDSIRSVGHCRESWERQNLFRSGVVLEALRQATDGEPSGWREWRRLWRQLQKTWK